jgi:hypothetical protein
MTLQMLDGNFKNEPVRNASNSPAIQLQGSHCIDNNATLTKLNYHFKPEAIS